MSLTDAQYTTLANHIRANTDPDVVAALAIRNDVELARLYNLDSDFWIWKSRVTRDDYRSAMVWTEVDQLTSGSARIWEWLTDNFTSPLDATDSNVRQGIADAFAANTTTRSNLLDAGKKLSSVYEKVFSSGAGTELNPGVADVEGPVSITIISKALNQF